MIGSGQTDIDKFGGLLINQDVTVLVHIHQTTQTEGNSAVEDTSVNLLSKLPQASFVSRRSSFDMARSALGCVHPVPGVVLEAAVVGARNLSLREIASQISCLPVNEFSNLYSKG